MENPIVGPEKMRASKVLGRFSGCQRMLEEAGLPFECWQWPIDDADFRARLVEFWRSRGRNSKPVSPTPHLIDCDATPHIPDGWKVREEDQLPGRVRGQFVWDPAKVKLYLSEKQQNGKYIEGNKLKKELANEPVLPANVLDFLLKNPHLIPEEWKKDANGNTRYIFFWGTIYRDSSGLLFVRFLYFLDGRWYWHYDWLGNDWYGPYPAAVRASS